MGSNENIYKCSKKFRFKGTSNKDKKNFLKSVNSLSCYICVVEEVIKQKDYKENTRNKLLAALNDARETYEQYTTCLNHVKCDQFAKAKENMIFNTIPIFSRRAENCKLTNEGSATCPVRSILASEKSHKKKKNGKT